MEFFRNFYLKIHFSIHYFRFFAVGKMYSAELTKIISAEKKLKKSSCHENEQFALKILIT